MTRQGQKFEHKILIGAMSTETHNLPIVNWQISDGRNAVPEFTLEIVDTSDAETIVEDVVVEIYRREYGEGTWGDAFLYGYVRSITKPLRSNTITVKGIGILGLALERTIPFAAWGNTHVVDQTLGVTLTISGATIQNLYASLDANLFPQVPLERLRFLMIQEGVWFTCNPGTWDVFDHGGGVSCTVAQQFMGGPGELRKLWIKAYQGIAGNNADLIFDIQSDNNGAPSGTVITTYTLPKGNIGVGSGNEAWIPVNLLANVADPTLLKLTPGQPFWLVLRLSAQGANNDIYIRCCDLNVGPCNRRAKESINAAAYALNATKGAIFFACDYEGHWQDLDYTRGDYMVETDKAGNNNLIFIRKTPISANDVGGNFNWGKWMAQVPILFTTQELVRATYWKGTITYATVFQKWAEAVASDLYATLTISITEPTNKQYCIQAENATGLDVYNLMQAYCPTVVRMYKNSAGNIIMEIKDALAPTAAVWNATYNATQKGLRTLYDGRDSPGSQAYVRLVDGQVFRTLIKRVETLILKDAAGNILTAVGSIGGTGKSVLSSSCAILGGIGGPAVAAGSAASTCIETALTVQQGGTITIEGIDQTMTQGPFRQANELCLLHITKKTINGYFAIQGIRWSGGKGVATKLELAFIDQQVTTKYLSTDKTIGFMGNGSFDNLQNLPSGTTIQLGKVKAGVNRNALDGTMTDRFHPAGATDCPTSGLEELGAAGMSLRADMPLMYRETGHTYLPAKIYFLQIGTGAPGGGVLGNKIAEVLASVISLPTGWVILQSKFHQADIVASVTWPQTITEFGIAYANDIIKTGFTQVGAYSVASPKGGSTVFGVQPQVLPGRRVTVAIQVVHN